MSLKPLLPPVQTLREITLATILLLAALFFAHQLWWIDLTIPPNYVGDGLFFCALIKNMLETGFYLHNPSLGTPFVAEYYDFPITNGLGFILIWFFDLFTDQYAVVYNLVYLSGFFLAGMIAFLMLRKMGARFALALTGAVLYACLPFHFMRIGHIFLAVSYCIAPITIYAASRILHGIPPFFGTSGQFEPLNFRWIAIALLLGVSDAYFAFFSFILIVSAALIHLLATRSGRNLPGSILFAGLLAAGFLATVSPNLVYKYEHGSNPLIAKRGIQEVEVFGLRITQLLLPSPQHRSDTLRQLTERYNRTAPLVNENRTAGLGLVGGVGFLILLLIVLSKDRLTRKPVPSLWELGVLNSTMLFYSTIGGFASLFALLIYPQFRSVNRISVFIGFAAVAAVTLTIEAFAQHRKLQPQIMALIILPLLALGLWDQTSPRFIPDRLDIKAKFTHDAQFIEAIENSVPSGAMIYQLPYISFPEASIRFQEGAYTLLRGYLHSNQLKWNHGNMRGRREGSLLKTLSRYPLEQQIALIIRAGFSGIYIERRAFPDHGQALETELNKILGIQPLTSQNTHLAFYRLPARGDALIDAEAMIRARGVLQTALLPPPNTILFNQDVWPEFVTSVQGMSTAEPWGRWSDSQKATFTFKDPLPEHFILKIHAAAFAPNSNKPFLFSIGSEQQDLIINNPLEKDIPEYTLCFSLVRKVNTLEITIPNPQAPITLGLGSDPRTLGIALSRLQILPIDKDQIKLEESCLR